MAIVRYQNRLLDISLNDRKHQFSDAAQRQRLCGDTACLGVDGRPASSARVSVGAFSCSTATILILPSYHDVMPAMSPPPPTATSNLVIGACCSNSNPTVPLPSAVDLDDRRTANMRSDDFVSGADRSGVLIGSFMARELAIDWQLADTL